MRKTKKYKEWVEKLKPYWKRRDKAYRKFREEELKIEKEMQEKFGIDDLEFFSDDMFGECCGIGRGKIQNRKKFPLVHDRYLADGLYERSSE